MFLEILVKTVITLAITAFVFFIVYRKNEDAVTIINTLKIAFMKKKNLKAVNESSCQD